MHINTMGVCTVHLQCRNIKRLTLKLSSAISIAHPSNSICLAAIFKALS